MIIYRERTEDQRRQCFCSFVYLNNVLNYGAANGTTAQTYPLLFGAFVAHAQMSARVQRAIDGSLETN